MVEVTQPLAPAVADAVAGDPATALSGQSGRAADVEYLRRFYGLDRPLLVQYGAWLARLGVGDFGNSLFFGFPVAALIAERLPVTIALGLAATAFAVGIGVPLGVLAATRPNGPVDLLVRLVAAIGQAMPTFWFGLTLILVFGVMLRWLPITGQDSWWNFVMPAVALGYNVAPAVMRLTRAGMLEVLASDYIRTARAKGLRPMKVLFKHALRNAVLPIVTIVGIEAAFLVGGLIVTETVFNIPGVARFLVEAIRSRDYPIVQNLVMFIAVCVVSINFLIDMAYLALDPRIAYEK